MTPGPRIRVAGLVVNGGRVLLVRQEKAGRSYWLLPGGGVEEGEEVASKGAYVLWTAGVGSGCGAAGCVSRRLAGLCESSATRH